MKDVFEAAGHRFLLVFLMTLATMSTGVLDALDGDVPNYALAGGLLLGAAYASVAAALKALQEFVPALSFSSLGLSQPYAAYGDAFIHAGLAVFLVSISGWIEAGQFDGATAALSALVVGALVAGARAVVGLGTQGESPKPYTGL